MDTMHWILKNVRPQDDFTGSVNFIEDGLLDSLDIVLLAAELDHHYKIKIKGYEITPENFRNFEAIAKLLEKHGVGL